MKKNYSINDKLEDFLLTKAQRSNIPLNGVFEITPLCNLNCKMCYVRLSPEEMKQQGTMISCDEWLRIADDAIENGTLYLLLTGGEPLVYPEFKKLYVELSKKGFVITVNTNGLLITEEIAKLFSEYAVRRVNITLYGADDETYGNLCNDLCGFSKVMKSVELLKKYEVPFRFNYTVTPYNHHCHKKIYEIANVYDAYVAQTTYIFPPVRRDNKEEIRLGPAETAKYIIEGNFLKNNLNTEGQKKQSAINSFAELNELPRNYAAGFRCSAGHREYFVNWKGEMFPCGVFGEPKISLLENSFSECWKYLVEEVRKLEDQVCDECEQCPKRNICNTCLAARFCETGKFSGKPEYLCKMTDEEIKYLLPYLDEEDQQKYKKLINVDEE